MSSTCTGTAHGTRRAEGWQRCGAVVALAVAIAMAGAGCGRPPAETPALAVACLAPAAADRGELRILREAFPDASYLNSAGLERELAGLRRDRRVLVVPPGRPSGPEEQDILNRHAEAGGAVVWWSPERPPPGGSPALRPYFRFTARTFVMDDGSEVAWDGSLASPWPEVGGLGGESAPDRRWLPIGRVIGSEEGALGWPVSILQEPRQGMPARQEAWIALPAAEAEEQQKAVAQALRGVAARLQQGCFLYRAGSERYTFEAGAPIALSARVAGGLATWRPLRVVAEWIEEGGHIERRVAVAAGVWSEDGGEPAALNLGTAPRNLAAPRSYTLRISLWDAAEQTRLDVLEQPVRVLPAASEAKTARIGVLGAGFTMGRRPVFLHGVCYEPAGRLPDGLADTSWLSSGRFDAAALTRYLDRLHEAGASMVSLHIARPEDVPQLRYVAEELRARNLYLLLSVEGLSPVSEDPERGLQLLEQTGLARDPLLCALDLSGRGVWGGERERVKRDAAWQDWLREQYGTVEHAERTFGAPLWRRDGVVAGPPDAALADPGPHRVAVAAYRRFAEDWTSRHLGYLRRLLTARDIPALLCTHGTAEPPEHLPLDPRTGAVHLDFLGVVTSPQPLPADPVGRALFLSAYAQGGLGKPVLWHGLGVPSQGSRAMRAEAVELDRLATQALSAPAAGFLLAPYPPAPDTSDLAPLLAPDGSWRDAGNVLRTINQRIRQQTPIPVAWRGQTWDPSDGASLLERWMESGDAFVSACRTNGPEQLLPRHADTPCSDVPRLGLGGRPLRPPAPWALLNAEWGTAEQSGASAPRTPGQQVPLRTRAPATLAIWNTGTLRWMEGSNDNDNSCLVFVRAEHATARTQLLPLKETAPGQVVKLVWTPSEAGRWHLRLWRAGGGFGERLDVLATD